MLAIRASCAPCRVACASATTFSAYDVVFAPATADRSLRVHGTLTTLIRSGHGEAGEAATIRRGAASPRLEPSGPAPPVSVIRRRPSGSGPAASSVWATASRTVSSRGSWRPRTPAERQSLRRWRVRAKGRPSSTLHVSKTPSPTVIPWSRAGTTAASESDSAPSTHTLVCIGTCLPCRASSPCSVELVLSVELVFPRWRACRGLISVAGRCRRRPARAGYGPSAGSRPTHPADPSPT